MLQLHPVRPDSRTPIWIQIRDALHAEISEGALQIGDRIPSEHELQRAFRASRTSVRAALGHLQLRGLIVRQQGRGAFVAAPSPTATWTLQSAASLLDDLQPGDRALLTSRLLDARTESLPHWAHDVLEGREQPFEMGFTLERLRMIRTSPAIYVRNHLPARFSKLLSTLRDPRASLYDTLARVARVQVARISRTLWATGATEVAAGMLGVSVGAPLIVVNAVAYDRNERILDVSHGLARPDLFRVSVESPSSLAQIGPQAASDGAAPLTKRRNS